MRVNVYIFAEENGAVYFKDHFISAGFIKAKQIMMAAYLITHYKD
jgi:hypothetical protein